MSESQKGVSAGEKHHAWKGGITPANMKIRNSEEMKAWRSGVMRRDNYTCQDCGKHGGNLEADHVMPFSLFPELRTELLNGRTLCSPCHKKHKLNKQIEQQLLGLVGMKLLEFQLP
jgi:hypothetical protein